MSVSVPRQARRALTPFDGPNSIASMKTQQFRTMKAGVSMGLAAMSCLLVLGCGAPPATESAPPRTEPMISTDVTNDVLQRHKKTLSAGDLEGVLADYADDAVLFTPGGPVRGKAALRETFPAIVAEWSAPGVKFEMKQETVDGAYAYTHWNAETGQTVYEGGQDAFVVQNGKITAHFFSAKMTPKPAAKK